MSETARISPTAFATGHMWVRLGLSHPALSTPRGKRLDRAFSYAIQPSRMLGRTPAFDVLMQARHLGIDTLLEAAIEDGRVGQVIELACGLSGRGWRMTQKYPDLTYLETDLPHMAELKRSMLGNAGLLSPHHRVLDVDALTDEGPLSLAQIASELDPDKGVAVITEGLLSYLDPETAHAVWSRIARTLGGFPRGVYLSDGYITSENQGLSAKFVKAIIERFVSGRMHVHYESTADAEQKMQAAGFARTQLHAPRDLPAIRKLGTLPGGNRVRVLEAWV